MKKRIISAILLCLMLLTLGLAACNDDTQNTSSSASEGNASQSDTEESTASVEEVKYLVPHLGERDLGGFELTICATDETVLYNKEQFAPEEEIGEPINDAAYNRNQLIQSEYNCEINVIFSPTSSGLPAKVENDILADACEYNVIIASVQWLAKLAESGWLYELKDLSDSNLDLDGAWWDQSANSSMTLCGMLFFATGDITVSDDLRTTCIYFNKDMIVDKGLENPYQLVYDKKWTIDVMHEMCRKVSAVGGDGVMNMEGDDTYGYVGASFDTYKLIVGTGCPQIERDSDGVPIIAMTNERNVNAFNKVRDFMTDKSCVAYLEQYYRWDDYDNNHKVADHFYNGQALFMCKDIAATGSMQMLNTDFNIGVIPCPKFDENQDEYVSAIDSAHYYAAGIPKANNMDIDKTTFVMEAMAYLSRQLVTPKFYEVTLKEKRFHDDDAPKMLDIIFGNRCVDLSIIYNWNNCIQYYNRLLPSNTSVLSFMESNGIAMQAAMDECIAKITSYPNY